MHSSTNQYLEKAYGINRISAFAKHAWMSLSLIVILIVFWWLKLTGITMAGEAFCGMTEHTHDETCGMPSLICELEETEGHVHDDTCLAKELVCELTEVEGHTHGEGCYTATLICTLDEIEGHVHGESCKEVVVICGLEESEEHTHGEECKKEEIICTLAEEEGHAHSEECYRRDLICELEEAEGHIHGETCYVPGIEYGCGLTECEPHVHGEACYGPAEECLLEEHVHTTECYSDINADLETQEQWEAVFETLAYSEEPQANIVAVAKSQLGYTESEKNFVVDENDEKNGYTRYGEWYGNPYGPWNTMFVSFCLNYAKIEDIPLSAGAETMRLEWEEAGIFTAEEDMVPWAGDIVFLDKNVNGSADAVAIVTAFEEGVISVIEGDLENTVAETTYLLGDAIIMGIGFVPIMTEMTTLETRAATVVATTYDYTGQNLSSNDTFILYAKSGNNYYAIDNNANAVPIYIDSNGNITADVADRNTIYWMFEKTSNYDNQPAYYIGNVASTKYVHPYNDGATDNGALHTGKWESALYKNGTGFKIRGARQDSYIKLLDDGTFNQIERNNSSNSDITIMYLGKAPSGCAVWLDGTVGGMAMYGGSPNTKYTLFEGEVFTLPTKWDSPTKYQYKIQGWYDVTNSIYYAPGAEVKVTGNMVFYPDWVAASYDIGIYNAQAANTVSSKELITTRVFDYNGLFNVMSANAEVDVSNTGHTENWTVVSSGKVDYKESETLNLIFIEYMSTTGKLLYPSVGAGHNKYDQNVPLRQGFLTDQMIKALFGTDNLFDPETGEGIIGKTYLGTGDYLFQYASDPEHPYYGYYYYDSNLHAASYNRMDQRFYVYDYLARTSDSGGSNSYADFLPLNSPYVNTKEEDLTTYNYDGVYGEYSGVEHYEYDTGSETNLGFGTSMEVKFYLENQPGETKADGKTGNRDLYGKEMNFEFTGDDDLWVYVDDELVLDMGGIHGAQNGSINFSTGIVTVNGNQDRTIYDMESGAHTLKIYYLERGGSQSNCAMYYNIAPLYGLNIQKEDVLTQEPLDGATFKIYTDEQCTKLAKLWKSEESYLAGHDPETEFTTADGNVDVWGLVAASTYYIKETGPPTAEGYERPYGIIRFSIDKQGLATYDAEIISEIGSNGKEIEPSNGFTVHNVSIDEEKQQAYITVTNAQNWVQDTTTVQVSKTWEDDKDHSSDYITVYLTVTDPDGTVRRIRSVVLSDENNWMYTWTNLPKNLPKESEEEEDKLITYGVAEDYEEGYYSQSTKVDKIVVDNSTFEEAYTFNSGGPYYLKANDKYLSTLSDSSYGFQWVSEKTALNSKLAQWSVISNKNNQIQLENGAGQKLAYTSGYFYATKGNGGTQTLNYTSRDDGITVYITSKGKKYYLSIHANDNDGTIQRTDNNNYIQVIQPMIYHRDVVESDVLNWGYMITNTPLEEETSLRVYKTWTLNGGTVSDYQQEQVTIRLLANGIDTGRTVTLNLKNGWTDIFQGLPYKDDEGNIISYTVEEVWRKTDWKVKYGPIITDSTNRIPTYSTTVENVQIPMGPELPSTGSYSRLTYTLCGGGIMLTSLITAIRLRRRKERRLK